MMLTLTYQNRTFIVMCVNLSINCLFYTCHDELTIPARSFLEKETKKKRNIRMNSIVIIISLLLLCASCVAAFYLRPFPLRYVRSLALYSSNNGKESNNKISEEFWNCIQIIRNYSPDQEESYFKNNVNKLLSHRDEAFDLLDEACVLIEKTESETIRFTDDVDYAIDKYNKIDTFKTLTDEDEDDDADEVYSSHEEHNAKVHHHMNAARNCLPSVIGNILKSSKHIASAKMGSTLCEKEMLLAKKHMLLSETLPLPLTLKHTAPAVLPIEAIFDSDSVGASGSGDEVDNYVDERGGERGSGGGDVDDAAKDEDAAEGEGKGEKGSDAVDRPIACKPRFPSTDDSSSGNTNGDAGYE